MKLLKIIFCFLFFCQVGQSLAADGDSYEASFHLVLEGKNIVSPNWNHSLEVMEKTAGLFAAILYLKVPSNYVIDEAISEKDNTQFNQKVIVNKRTTKISVLIKNADKKNVKAILIIEIKFKQSRLFLTGRCKESVLASFINESPEIEPSWKIVDCAENLENKNNIDLVIYKLFDQENVQELTLSENKRSEELENIHFVLKEKNSVIQNHHHFQTNKMKLLLAPAISLKFLSSSSRVAAGLYTHYRESINRFNFMTFMDFDLLNSDGKLIKENQYFHLGTAIANQNLKAEGKGFNVLPELAINFKYINPSDWRSKTIGFCSGNLLFNFNQFFISPGMSIFSTESKFTSYNLAGGLNNNSNLIQLRYSQDNLKYDGSKNVQYHRWSFQIGKYF